MLEGSDILVTGGAGFVGSNLILKALDRGCSVRATVHNKGPQIVDKRVEYVHCDLERREDCHDVCRDMDYIFLCAANTSGAAVMEKTPLAHLTPNVLINTLMLEAAYMAAVKKVLFISSNTVYPLTDYPVKEDEASYNFFSKYFIVGWMKQFSEIICEMYSTKINVPMHTVVVRPANIYGPMDDFEWETSHVLPALIRRVVERHDPISIWGDGSDIKDFIYIDDFIDGMLLAMDKTEGFDVFNIASGNQYRLKDLLDLIIKIDGYENAKIEYDTTKPTMIPRRLIDGSKAENLLGFKARTDIEDGLTRTIQWYRRSR